MEWPRECAKAEGSTHIEWRPLSVDVCAARDLTRSLGRGTHMDSSNELTNGRKHHLRP